MTACSSSSTTIVVGWNHLPDGDFQGEPIGYDISFHPANLKSDIHFVRVNFTTNTTSLTHLTVYSMYVIYVSAVSSGGIGPANTARTRTDAAGRDGSPMPERKS